MGCAVVPGELAELLMSMSSGGCHSGCSAEVECSKLNVQSLVSSSLARLRAAKVDCPKCVLGLRCTGDVCDSTLR